jgi:hypothetical protein
MNIDSAFPSNYLKASDLGDGQPVVTIDRVEIEAVGRSKEMKPVVYFKGKEKGLVLNKTNGNKIAQITGSKDTDDWHGCQIKLYATETEFGGETVECIRIKPAVGVKTPKVTTPKVEQPAAVAEAELTDDDIPF